LFKSVLTFITLSLTLLANECSNTYPEGLPAQTVDTIICKKSFAIGYSFDTKTPIWAIERLSKDQHLTHLTLEGFRFRRDYALSRKHRSTSSDYAYSTQDRSQLIPFEDVNTNHFASSDTFLMSNIAPQNAKLNRHAWVYLERGVRELADVYGEIVVVTGVAFLHDKPEDIERIGTHKVAVPTHYYKAVYAPNTVDGPKMWAWLVPNKAVATNDMKNYRISVDTLEHQLKINLFPNLKPSLQASIESKYIPL